MMTYCLKGFKGQLQWRLRYCLKGFKGQVGYLEKATKQSEASQIFINVGTYLICYLQIEFPKIIGILGGFGVLK